MKKYLFCLLTLCCAATSLSAAAADKVSSENSALCSAECTDQTADSRSDVPRKQRMSRLQLAELQANRTAKQLQLDEATTKKYIKTYCEMMEEIWKIAPRDKGNSDSEEEAKKAMEQRFERSKKILQLREKYYKIYSTFLTPKQIQLAYRLEMQTMRRLRAQQRAKKKAAL